MEAYKVLISKSKYSDSKLAFLAFMLLYSNPQQQHSAKTFIQR